jgi:outer membrane lipoprotein-sorting protein
VHLSEIRIGGKKAEKISMKFNPLCSMTVFFKATRATLVFSALSVAMSSGAALAQTAATPAPAKAGPPQTAETKPSSPAGGDQEAVLAKMNQSSGKFKTAQGDFEFQTYQELTSDTDSQKGRIYFRRTTKGGVEKGGVDAAFDVEGSAPKHVVYKDGKLRIFDKNINQVTERNVGKNKSDVEAFLSLGFGASGDELQRDYDVKFMGWETVDGVKTAKLDLTPKKEKVRQTYNKIVLWIDPDRDVLLKQQFFERSGDWRLAHYTNMKINDKIRDEVFELKTNGKTRTISPQ